MTPKRKETPPDTPYLRFYNEAAADDKVYRDRIYGQVYNKKNQGYGPNVTLRDLFDQAEDDPELAATLNKMFMAQGADTPAFTKRFTTDLDFARMYADVEGSRGKEQNYKTISPKYRADYSLPDNQGECGAGASVACDPGKAKKLAKRRVAKGPSEKDKVKARIEAAMALRDVPAYKRTQYEGVYDRFGERVPDEYQNQAVMSMADRDVGNLMMMLGAMSGQGDQQYVPADRFVAAPSFSMNAQ